MPTRFLIFLFCPLAVFCQSDGSSTLLLKKGNKTIGRYFKGVPMQFFTTEKMPVSGIVERISTDSIFLSQYNIRRIQTQNGGILYDTMGKFNLQFSIANIGSFPAGRQKGKNIITEGTLLLLAGSGYLVLNIFNTTRQGDPPFGEENLPNVLIGAGIAATGFILKKAWPKKLYIGKKYQLKVIES